ncbi:Lumazine-binding domain [Dillenia turbinata]|uniref:Lumazine-binding domain n=1 Tax=Dillenia turbinata TaxID=194707 RepID=A0AAN8Z9C6_9MAGN
MKSPRLAHQHGNFFSQFDHLRNLDTFSPFNISISNFRQNPSQIHHQSHFYNHFQTLTVVSLLHNPPKAQTQIKTIRTLFTGRVEEIGEIEHLGFAKDGAFHMKINAKVCLQNLNSGDSISVNGTCLTVTEFDTKTSNFTVGLAPETEENIIDGIKKWVFGEFGESPFALN